MMYTTDELFDRNNTEIGGPDRLYDVLMEVIAKRGEPERTFTDVELRIVFDALPTHVRDIAHCWSISDTVFADEAFLYLEAQGVPYLPDAA